MDIKKRAKEELEHRIERIEDFIAERGIGSSYLTRAKKVQRNVNLALFLGSAITVGVAIWLMSKPKREEKEED